MVDPLSCSSCGELNRPGGKFCGACAAPLSEDVSCAACSTRNPAGQKFCDTCGELLSRESADRALPGSFGHGRYDVVRLLGEGARKRVYLARDTRLGREVAIARIKTEGLDALGAARVRREAEAMGRLGDHPNIVTIYDIVDDEGQLYLVSECMQGGDLADLLGDAEDHRLSVEETTAIGEHICRALEHAHSQNIIHRDLKPKNVWLTHDGVAKLGDFGLAVALDRSRLSSEGLMVGTVAYMPPEQGLGGAADPRSDLYSLGALLYELLCGRPPFLGDDAVAVISQHINTPPVAPSWHTRHVPRLLEELILSLLAKSPDDRPNSSNEVRQALAAISSTAATPEFATPEDGRTLELTSGVFVGREQETKALRSSLDEALSGQGRMVMLAGEAGIGKTRLAEDLKAYATLRGAHVLWGRCYEGEGAPAYWPWVQVIRSYVHNRDAASLSSEMGAGAADIAQVVSEVKEQLPGLPEPPSLEPEQARFRLFDSIGTFLANASQGRPLVIVLDDLHWADKPSLLLLRFLARELRDARVLVLGTYRDVELDREHPLSEVLGALRRGLGYERILLRGLSAEGVRAMLEGAAQHELEDPGELALVDAVHRETEGNPFFVDEILRHLVESGGIYQREGRWASDPERIAEIGIPESVRQVVGRRLARLSQECNELLAIASVIGREFRFETLERVSRVPADVLLERLDEAFHASIVEEVAGDLGRYTFSHAIIRETLYEERSAGWRRSLHGQIGDVLEDLYADEVQDHLGELAHHFLEAARPGDAERAASYAARAGARAAERLAYEEAAGYYARALQLLELQQQDDARRCDLLLALGDAQWRSGDTQKAKASFKHAAETARGLRAPQRFARAALGYGAGLGGFGATDRADEVLTELLHQALKALPEDDSELRVRVMARLAVELYYTDAVEERAALGRRAVEVAERLGDPDVQLIALYSRHWSALGPDGLDEQREAATEIVRLARLVRDREMEFRGHHFAINTLLQLGDMEAVDAEIAACAELAKQLRQPHYLWQTTVFHAIRALISGRFQEGEELARQAFRIGRRGQQEITFVVFGVQTWGAHWGQGRFGEIEEGAKGFAERYPRSAWPGALAFLYSELDREADARAAFEAVARDDFASLRRDANWVATLVFVSRACGYLRDSKRARILYELLLPYRELFAPVLAGAGHAGCASLALGVLAGTIGRHDEAAGHFEHTLDRYRRMGMRPFIAWTQHDYARMLLHAGRAAKREQALAIVTDALEMARALGMGRLVEQLMALKAKAQGLRFEDLETSITAVAESVHAARPDLRPVAAPDGTVALMFCDIEASSLMAEKLGSDRWLEVLRGHSALVRKHLAGSGGFEMSSRGDGFLLAFASARRALLCAMELQRSFAAYRRHLAEEHLRIRIGVHMGEAVAGSDDFFDKHVTLAAGVADQANGDEILVSSLVRDVIGPAGEFTFDDGRDAALEGFPGAHRIFSVAWTGRRVDAPAAAGLEP